MNNLLTTAIITLVVNTGSNGIITNVEAELFCPQRGSISYNNCDVSSKPQLANHHFEFVHDLLVRVRQELGGTAIILGDNRNGQISQFRTELRKHLGLAIPECTDIGPLLRHNNPPTVLQYLRVNLPNEDPSGEYNLGLACYTRMAYLHMHGISPYREEAEAA